MTGLSRLRIELSLWRDCCRERIEVDDSGGGSRADILELERIREAESTASFLQLFAAATQMGVTGITKFIITSLSMA